MLHGNFDCNAVFHPFTVNDLIIERRLASVQICHELLDSSLIVESMFAQLFLSPVPQYNLESFGEKRHFSEPLLQYIIIKYSLFKYLCIREECNLGTAPIRFACTRYFEFIAYFSSFVALLIYLSFVIDLNLQPFGKGIYNRCTYTVKTAGYLISSASEFTAGMKHCKYDLHCRKSCLMIDSHRDSPSVVTDSNGIIFVYINLDFIAVSCKCLIY